MIDPHEYGGQRAGEQSRGASPADGQPEPQAHAASAVLPRPSELGRGAQPAPAPASRQGQAGHAEAGPQKQPNGWLTALARRPLFLLSVLALLVALATRLPYFVRTDFPLNDGGLFLTMSLDILGAHFTLPLVTSYNSANIPFAYPPFSFYLVAVLARLTGLAPLTLLRFLPLLANLGTVVAVAILARQLTRTWWAAVAAALLFPLIPRSFTWMIMGGGLTRSLGFLFATLCLCLAVNVFRRPTPVRSALCAICAALALASHIELGMFVGYSLVLFAVLPAWRPRAWLICAGLLAAMVVLTAPWWWLVLHRDGLEPFYAASLTGEWSSLMDQIQLLLDLLFPLKVLLGLIGACAVLGAAICFLRGAWLLPVWLFATFVINPRSAASEGTVPFALLAGIGLAEVVLPGLIRAVRFSPSWSPSVVMLRVWSRVRRSQAASVAIGGLALVLALALLFVYWPSENTDEHALDSLTPAERQAMTWVGANTPSDSSFLVLSTTWSWEEDLVGEWFPTLAQRHSVLTPQGDEWLPAEMHARAVCGFTKVRDIAAYDESIDDLDSWAQTHQAGFTDIFISQVDRGTVNWDDLIASARRSPNYTFLLDTPTATVLHRTTPLVPEWPESGPLMLARDCQSLGDQNQDTQTTFTQAYAGQADARWVAQHDGIIGKQAFVANVLGRFGLLDQAGP